MKPQNQKYPVHKIPIRPPLLTPKITNIGYGNPRYNSMLSYKDQTILVPCGSSLRQVNLKNDQILMTKQIGQSQIFQLVQNTKYIVVVNFEGLLTFLNKETLQILRQFYMPGKEVRHLSLTDYRLVVSCELSQIQFKTKLCIYRISQIQLGIYQPSYIIEGNFYFPEQISSNNDLIVIEYEDPNPKGRSRTQTVLIQKKPIKHRIVKFIEHQGKIKQQELFLIKEVGQIICAVSNQNYIFYLHPGRKITLFNDKQNFCLERSLPGKSIPLMIQRYKDGFIWSSAQNQLTYAKFDSQQKDLSFGTITIKSPGIGGNLSIKPLNNDAGFFLFNQRGLHHYSAVQNKTFTQAEFQITNCGLSLNQDGSQVAVGDFAGNVNILLTDSHTVVPKPIKKINVGMPIRALVWCHKSNLIVIGCVGGSLFTWDINDFQPIFIDQLNNTTVNILRYAHEKVFIGTSDGDIKILDQQNLSLCYQFKAHHPIIYETQRERQLFGSMKNYAEIWSLTVSPFIQKDSFVIVSSSQDQTQKIFHINEKNHSQLHHLKGHQLAVTSVDWKVMGKSLGEIYVSCSDDKKVRFRDPKDNFRILFELQTNTIKQWHTLTYLALEQNGTRVAIGSQNGYLFIFDLQIKQLIFGQKIHLGGVQGLDWKNNKLITCSSDLCISILDFTQIENEKKTVEKNSNII